MRRLSLIPCIWLLASKAAWAEFDPLSLKEMANKADAIVVGEIVQVTKDHFTLQVKDVIIGRAQVGRSMVFHCFGDWACARRFGPYEKGQRALIFATSSPDGVWRVCGAGNEGESPIVGDRVYAHYFMEGEPLTYGKASFIPISYRQALTAILAVRPDLRLAARLNAGKPTAPREIPAKPLFRQRRP